MKHRCETCEHFNRLSPDSTIGECHLAPSNGRRRWPLVGLDDGCDHWEYGKKDDLSSEQE